MAEPPAGDVSSRLMTPRLVVDEPLMKKASSSELTPSRLGFPSEFPYEFGSPTFSSAFTTPGDSTETEEESSDDEEDFLAGLTRRLALSTQRLPVLSFADEKTEEKSQVIVSSPQSTLSGLGSWSASGSGSPNGPSSQVPSPPTTPFRKDDAWDVISAAAGQVARLKMGSYETPLTRPNPSRAALYLHARLSDPTPPAHEGKPQNAALWSEQGFQQYYSTLSNQSNQFLGQDGAAKQSYAAWGRQPKSSYYQSLLKFEFPEQQIPKRASDIVGCENGRYLRPFGLSKPPWLPSPPPQQPSAAVRSVTAAGSVPKRTCAGTGVFLPRRYTNSSDSRKKSGNSGVVLPSKVVHPQNPSFDEIAVRSQRQSQPCLSTGFSQYDYECLMARRNAILAQQRRSLRPVGGGCLNHEMPLPQEWLY